MDELEAETHPAEPCAGPPLEVPPESGSMKRLGRNALVYGIGMVLSRAVSFLLLPVYTRYLTPDDYGVLQLLQISLDIVGILLSAGTTTGVLRFYFKATTDRERSGVVVTAFAMLAGLNAAGALILSLLAPWLAQALLKGAGSPACIRIAACNFALDACISVPLLLMQARGRAALYNVATLGKLALGLSLNILFVVGFGWKVEGILTANLITLLLVGSSLVAWMARETRVPPNAGAARDLRRFGLPHQVAMGGAFILTFGDRFFLQAFHGLAAVGLYGLAYQFGFLLVNLGASPYFRAWSPHRLQLAAAPREFRDERYNQGFRYLNLILVSLAVGISLFIRPILAIMSDPSFHPAAAMVPVILAAYLVQVWTEAVSLGIEVSERTKYVTYATWISVACILVLYTALIPRFAGMGAAVATLAAFVVRLVLVHHWSQKLWPVSWRWSWPLGLAGAGAGLVTINEVAAPGALVSQIGLAAALGLAYAGVVWAAFLSEAERGLLVKLVRAPKEAMASVFSK
jgi:O-antigen/teichoic acid export membrane protein